MHFETTSDDRYCKLLTFPYKIIKGWRKRSSCPNLGRTRKRSWPVLQYTQTSIWRFSNSSLFRIIMQRMYRTFLKNNLCQMDQIVISLSHFLWQDETMALGQKSYTSTSFLLPRTFFAKIDCISHQITRSGTTPQKEHLLFGPNNVFVVFFTILHNIPKMSLVIMALTGAQFRFVDQFSFNWLNGFPCYLTGLAMDNDVLLFIINCLKAWVHKQLSIM